MKLHNLPKDIIIDLVSKLQSMKEKEYSDYVVISAAGSDDPFVWYFDNEQEFKAWILYQLFPCPKEICGNENIWLFLEGLGKVPRNHYGHTDHRHMIEYCKNNSSSFQLDELLNLLNKIDLDFVIIKGKRISGNTNTIQGF